MKTVAIVQARVGSSRLPAKVLADLGGATMLARVVERARAAISIDEVVVATTELPDDDVVAHEAERIGAGVFRGAEHDVLARYVGAARAARAGVVVRITADCPLLDPDVIDDAIMLLRKCRTFDYVSNTHRRTFPRGLDVEAFYLETLERIGFAATSQAAREHVTAFLFEMPALFSIGQIVAPVDDSDLRWTVDTPEDLALARALYTHLDLGRTIAPYRRVVEHVRAAPELAAINADIVQKPWHGHAG